MTTHVDPIVAALLEALGHRPDAPVGVRKERTARRHRPHLVTITLWIAALSLVALSATVAVVLAV